MVATQSKTVDLLYTAAKLVTEARLASPSMLMRNINQNHGVRLTFATANQLLAQMRALGIIGPPYPGSRPSDVLMEWSQARQALNSEHGGSYDPSL